VCLANILAEGGPIFIGWASYLISGLSFPISEFKWAELGPILFVWEAASSVVAVIIVEGELLLHKRVNIDSCSFTACSLNSKAAIYVGWANFLHLQYCYHQLGVAAPY
jgi:hypothetical protein